MLIYVNRGRKIAHRQTISAMEHQSTAFDMYRFRTDAKASAQDAVIISYRDAISTGLLDNDRLKELNIKEVELNIRLTEKIAVLEKEAAFDNPPNIVYRDTSINNVDTLLRYIQLPFGFGYTDKWVNLHATVDESPIFDTLAIWSYPEITLGWQRQGFLKKKERKIFYTNENPYVYIEDMQNVVINEPKKWFQTDVAKVSGGIVAFEVIRLLLSNQ